MNEQGSREQQSVLKMRTHNSEKISRYRPPVCVWALKEYFAHGLINIPG